MNGNHPSMPIVTLPVAKHWLPIKPVEHFAWIACAVGALCLLLSPWYVWLTSWPTDLTIPATRWIGIGLTTAFEVLKPSARAFSALLNFPMRGINWLLVNTPYTLIIGFLTALAWYLGRLKMALLVFLGLLFILASGYWVASMNTLALVCLSVPLALLLGSIIGLLANEFHAIKRVVNTLLDVMQTVPTFAYLTPLLLLFGFGPVVGLIASIIYAAPPMARNMMLGLSRIEPEIRQAAIMNGATRLQQLFLVEIPTASRQIMIGVNQSIMAALSMVIIAAVIGGFNDIGWEVLLTMRRAAFGQSLIAGLVIVIFAVLADRLSGAFVLEGERSSWHIPTALLAIAVVLAIFQKNLLPSANELVAFKGLSETTDSLLSAFIASNGSTLDSIKNFAMFYILLPLRIGLESAVLPFIWGFQWQAFYSQLLYLGFVLIALMLAFYKRITLGLCLLMLVGVLLNGISNLPWPFLLVIIGGLGWLSAGKKSALFSVLLFLVIPLMGLWQEALLSLYLCSIAVLICVLLGGLIGLFSSLHTGIWSAVRPFCDFLQTIPQFVFLIPVLMFFQIGEFSAFLAICAYAIVPMIRYSYHGLSHTPADLIESAIASGANSWQIMCEVRIPWAIPTLLLGLNQTILYAFSMLVIAALVGTTDLGQQIYLALGQGDVGLGVAAGASMAIMALIADRLVQGFANKKRLALGLS